MKDIKIGPYALNWFTYAFRDPADGQDKEETSLFITHDSGEAMGCNPKTVDRLVIALDAVWKTEF